jgi:hypothetical protein
LLPAHKLRKCPLLGSQPLAVVKPVFDTATARITGAEALARLCDASGLTAGQAIDNGRRLLLLDINVAGISQL